MKNKSAFTSFIDQIKKEMDELKESFEELDHSEYDGNVLRSSTKPKKKKKKTKHSMEGISQMTDSFEGKSQEVISMEGESIMNNSMEGKSKMDYSVEYQKSELQLTKNDENYSLKKKIKVDKLGLKDKDTLVKAFLMNEIIGKPKGLK